MFGFTLPNSRPDCGLKSFTKNGGVYSTPVPLKSVNIHADLINFCALVKVEQIYMNTETNPIECEFSFPIEESSAILSFKAVLDGRTLISKVKLNEEAEADYKKAIAEGKTGFLAQATRQDILNIKIGHLSTGSSCSITITYITEANLEDGKIRLTIPTTISPKYIPPATKHLTEVQKIANIEYSMNSPAPMKFTVKATMKSRIEAMTSPSHSIRISSSGIKPSEDDLFVGSIELEASTADLDRDIVVLVACESSSTPIALLEEIEQSKVVMVSLVPNLKLPADPKYDVIFLVDCSGSMQGSSIKLARDAINILLHSLPHSTHFNIVRFGSSFQKLFPNSVPYSNETLAYAKMNIQHMQADLGGTEILTPLKKLLEEETMLPRRIFVLTDGSVSNSMECLNVTSKFNKKCKVFALGIGSSADRHLVKGLARAGEGTSQFTTEGEIIAPKIIQQLKQCLQPTLTNIKIDWGFPVDESISCQAPYTVPMLYSGTRIQVFRLVDKTISVPEKVTIMADIPSEERKYSEDVIVNARPLKSKVLHQMFAKKMIQSLEEQEDVEDAVEMKEIIKELALKYQLMSKYTSIIAVDSEEKKTCLPMQSRNIPNQVPSGFQSSPAFGQSQQRIGLFGAAPSSDQLFGATAYAAPSSGQLFGAKACAAPSSGQLFAASSAGSNSDNTGFSFGATVCAAPSSSQLFGATAPSSGQLFGAKACAAPFSGQQFGDSSVGSNSVKTGFSFGSAVSSSNTPFGNRTAGHVFGDPSAGSKSVNTGFSFGAAVSGNNTSFENNTTGFGSTNTGFGGNNMGPGNTVGPGVIASGFGSNTDGNNSPGFGSNRTGFRSNNTGFGGNASGFGGNTSGFGSNSTGFGSNNTGFGGNASGFGGNTSGFGSNSTGFGGSGLARPSIPFGGYIPAQGFNNTGFGNSSNAPGGAFMLQDSGNKKDDDPMNNVLQLISLQTAEGSFDEFSQIQEILKLDKSEKLQLIAEEVDSKIFCTLLVIIGLEKKFCDLKSCWELVVEKANNYLNKQAVPQGLSEKIHKVFEE